MKKAGILLIALSIFSAFFAFNMDVVIRSSYNIGLLNERQNIVYLSGVLFLAGIMLFGFGVVAKEESKNLNTFALWTFLTPIALLAMLKIVFVIQEKQDLAEKAQQTEQAKIKILQENSNNFMDNKNGTVTFKLNGLIWQKCSVGQTWNGETCSGEAIEMTWDETMKVSVSFAGHNDWRLPTKEELMTLVFCSDGKYNASGSCENILAVSIPTINLTYFPNAEGGGYWSSSPSLNSNLSDFIWIVYFIDGSSSDIGYKKHGSHFVRLVRK